MVNDRDIAIVGMACFFPKAPNLQQYWRNLANGVDGISDRPPKRWRYHRNFDAPPDHDAYIPFSRGGFLGDDVLFDPVPYGTLPNLVRYGDPDQFFMLEIIDRALKDAKIAEDAAVRERTDLIMGRGAYPTGKLVELTFRAEVFETVLEMIDRKFPDVMTGGRRDEFEHYLRSCLTPQSLDNVSTAVSNISASRAANRLNLRGAAYAVDAACASSLLAVEQAMWRLRNGLSDVAVTAGLFLSMTPAFLYVFTRLGALSPTRMSRPLDARSDGLLVGEGGGAVVLKRLEDAYRDGDQVYAILKGAGSSSDGKEVDVLAPSSVGQIKCLERAYADAQVDPASIGYLELHGTGTVVGDEVEINTVKNFYGRSATPPASRAMASVKSMIGHTMPAAGMASFIKMALSLSNKVMPPTLNCEQPRPELADAPFYVITQTRPWIHSASQGPRRAGINSFGFGGINAHVVLEEALPPNPKTSVRGVNIRPVDPGVRRPSELLVFSSPSVDGLLERLRRVERFIDESTAEPALADLAWSTTQEIDLAQPCKLAIICEDLPQLRGALTRSLEKLSASGTIEKDENIYFSASAAEFEGKVALLFPGMGFPGLIGNYPDHLMELCLHYPEVREEFDFFEDRDRHPDDTVPTSSIFSPPPALPEDYRMKLKKRLAPPRVDDMGLGDGEASPEERYLAAMGVTLSNWVGWVLLRKFQIPVGMVAGQSQGEMAALCVAGVSDFHESAPNFWKVLNIDTRDAGDQRLAFAWATAEKIEPLLAEHPGTYLAIYMAPEGVIFGGDREGLVRIAEKLRAEQILVNLLPYPPIHTPALSHLRNELTGELHDDDFRVQAPKVDVYSSITTEKYPSDKHGIRETLMLNIDHPLRIWQTIRKMYEDGARMFVQVGGGHMAAHLERLLPEGSSVVTAAMDVDTRNPLTQLNHLCARIFAAGVRIDLSPLYEHRRVERLDLDARLAPPSVPRMAIPLRIDWSPLYHENVPATPLNGSHAAVSHAPSTNGSAHTANGVASETPAPPPHVEPAPAAVPEEPVVVFDPEIVERLPVLGQVLRFAPEQEIVIARRLDLAEDLYLHDHLFVYAKNKPLSERLPVLPLTMSIEFAAEAASLLAPGLGMIGLEHVRGHRWIGMRESSIADLRIEARLHSVDPETEVRRFQVSIFFEDKLSFSATVLCGAEYRQDVQFELADSSQDQPWPFPLEDVYTERYMFHGPAFHCVGALYTVGNPGASAGLLLAPQDRLFASRPNPILLTDPCAMDGIGQIMGLWSMVHDQCVLPTGAEKVEFYRPTPPPGTLAPIRVEVTELNLESKQMRCNIEVEDGQGAVWLRVVGWTEFMWKWSQQYSDSTRLPNRFVLSDELALPGLPEGAVCSLTPRSYLKDVDLDWAARIFLHSDEIAECFGLQNHKRKRQHLSGRIAAKDAARIWLARRMGTQMMHPAEFTVARHAAGAPYLAPLGDLPLPEISFSHVDDAAIAVAADVKIGIDMEPVTRDTRSILPDFATASEIALIDNLVAGQPGEAWETRLWCAKEAAAKLLGIGLGGRPKDFVILDGEADGCLLMQHAPSKERIVVRTVRHGTMIIAFATSPEVAEVGAPPAGVAYVPDRGLPPSREEI